MTDEHKWHLSQGATKAWHRRRLEEGRSWAKTATNQVLEKKLRDVNEGIAGGCDGSITSEVSNTEWKGIIEEEIARRQACTG